MKITGYSFEIWRGSVWQLRVCLLRESFRVYRCGFLLVQWGLKERQSAMDNDNCSRVCRYWENVEFGWYFPTVRSVGEFTFPCTASLAHIKCLSLTGNILDSSIVRNTGSLDSGSRKRVYHILVHGLDYFVVKHFRTKSYSGHSFWLIRYAWSLC